MSFESYYQMTDKPPLTAKNSNGPQETPKDHRSFHRMYIITTFLAIILTFMIANLISSYFITAEEGISKTEKIAEFEKKTTEEKPVQELPRYIYIDVGCFNGESIDHFLHFTPNSSFYEIFAFEPDPDNYLLCKQRLSGTRFANSKVTVIPKIAWIRDEKIYFRSERGRLSRVGSNTSVDDGESRYLDAIDFSAWLGNLPKSNRNQIHIKLSIPGAEVPVLEKMVSDDTVGIAHRYEIEWTDRENPLFRGRRIYIQLMLDTYGFDSLYYTRLQDVRKMYHTNDSFDRVTKFYDWTKISESDSFAHYLLRPDVFASTAQLIGNKPKLNHR